MTERVAWVDYGKGLCIFFVVMMHSTLGVGEAMSGEGYMHYVVAFAAPFRMPDFFLIAGLFLWKVIDRPWTTYLDRKVAHFFYFYVLWLAIQLLFKAPGIAAEEGAGAVVTTFFMSFVDPFGTLWFIYMLPVFFIITRLIKNIPTAAVLVAAAIFEISHIETGNLLIDEFAARYIYFYIGYRFAEPIFRFADLALRNKNRSIIFLGVWAVLNGLFVAAGVSGDPIVSLGLGIAGAMAIVISSALLSTLNATSILRYLGRNSIVVYLAFFLPMAISREILIRIGVLDTGTVSLLVTIAGVAGPVIGYELIKRLPFLRLNFLFERPRWARLDLLLERRTRKAMQPAE